SCFLLNVQAASAAARAETPLDELRRSFTVGGKPVPPEVFRDLGDGDLADSDSILVTVDVTAAIGSNRYFDGITTTDGWVTQIKPASKREDPVEQTAYMFIGRTANDLLIVIASYSGGGSGVFYTLHILGAVSVKGLNSAGKRYDRLNVTAVRSVPLGDRWDGRAKIDGNAISIETTGRTPDGQDQKSTTRIIRAERP
ncbi:MAG: hypothetical protein P4M05_02855, partial [Bradyrhizobium sp.]|nr:hypothetical protein [Bradyrhizobium sp.]